MSCEEKKVQDQTRVKDQDKVEANKKFCKEAGIAQKPILEALPKYNSTPSEKVIAGENNCFVILGRDRPGNEYTGFGGKGSTGAGRIDLIAGLSSSNIKDGQTEDPNFALDGARVYISQRADIDRYMGLASTPREAPAGRSTVGIKADTLRFHAREDIKIVTGRMRYEGFDGDGEKLSTGCMNEPVGTISLIAGNYTEEDFITSFDILDPFNTSKKTGKKLQPIPKGNNLSSCLEDIIDAISQLSSMVGENSSMIQQMDLALALHTHPVIPPLAIAPHTYTVISPLVQARSVANNLSRNLFNKGLQTMKNTYLHQPSSPIHINSEHVFTT